MSTRYLHGLGKMRRGLNGKRIRPCQPTTIRTRRAELVAVARMAVRIGMPIESLTSLAALLHPDVVEPVIEAYWEKNGEEPKVFTIDLGWKLLSIAREIGGLNEAALERLDDIRASLEDHRRFGLTEKNLKLVRQVLTDGIWSEVTSLPNILMRQARADQGPRADQGSSHRAACRRHRDPDLCAGSAFKPRQHRTRPEPDQARRPELALLAGLPAL